MSSMPSSMRGSIGYISLYARASDVIQKLNDVIAAGQTITEEGNVEGTNTKMIHVVRPQTEMDELEVRIKDYKDKVVGTPEEIRTFVVNRLIQETHTAKAGDRLKALELIGKIGEIGLFNEDRKNPKPHGSTEELEKLLRGKIQKIIDIDKEGDDTVVDTVRKSSEAAGI